jgi:hypothetical protein
MSTAISPALATADKRIQDTRSKQKATRTPQQAMSALRNKSALTPDPKPKARPVNKRLSQQTNNGNRRGLMNTIKSRLRFARRANQNRGNASGGLVRNSRFTRDAKIRQLLNTYLTFAYEMGPGMEVKHFSRYVILIMFSMDQIANSTKNSTVYKNLYEQVGSISGIVDFKIQQQFATLISGYLRNVGKIKSSASVLLYKTLNQNVLKRQNKSLNIV